MHTWHRTMDGTDVAIEESSKFEDVIGDPELEARLYAEIYFSNETYEDNTGTVQTISKTSGPGENVTPLLSSETLIADVNNLDITSVSVNEENPATPNFFYDHGRSNNPTSSSKDDCRQANCRVENTTFANTGSYRTESTEHIAPTRPFRKQQRLLCRKDLWLSRGNTGEQTSVSPSPVNKPSKNLTARTKSITNKHIEITEKARTITTSNERNSATEKPQLLKKKKEKNKTKKKGQIQKEPIKKKQKGCKDLLNNSGVTTETSKYSIISKKMKLNMREAKFDTLSISSESDDSILEVPIPPKAQPPLIELPDSDEDSDAKSSVKKKNHSRSVDQDKERTVKASSAAKVTCEYDEPSTSRKDTDCNNEVSEMTTDGETADSENIETICDNSTDLILNCSNPQRDSSNLGENAIESTEISSVNSTTEKETNLEHTDADATENSEIFPVDRSSANNTTTIDSTGETIDVVHNDTNISCTNTCEIQNEKTKRKRQKDSESKSSKENVSGTPGKKRKQNVNSSSDNNSMTDYFFKPMTNEMQAYYNGPCGSENMDVVDIQSRMPSHPSNWKILHADLLPPTRKRGRVCPRCRNDTHHGKRCPEQATIPSCSMCGTKGHVETRCPQTMCLTCGHKYTSFRQTCLRCAKLSCDMCHGMGHTRQNCPDLWRRFHDITTETLPVPKNIRTTMKDPQHLSCCNCAKRGHAAAMCTQLRWSQHFPTPVYVSNYTEGPFYPEFQPQNIEDGNTHGNIDAVDVSDNNDSILIESTNERLEPNSIFQCGNLDSSKISTFTVISKRLDILPNVHLDGLLAGQFEPRFLREWKNHFTFNVNITQSSEDGIRLVIQADCHDVVHGIEKILMQWLTRSDFEKPYMQHDCLRFGNMKSTIRILKRAINLLDNTKDPKLILQTIVQLAQKLQKESINVIQNSGSLQSSMSMSNSCKRRKKKQPMQTILKRLIKARIRLVTALYGRSLVAGGEVTVRQFRKLVRRIIFSSDQSNWVRDYIDSVYLYNELFTYHESDALTQALRAVTSTADPVGSLNPSHSQNLINASGSMLHQTNLENSAYNIIDGNNFQPALASAMIANNTAEQWSTSGPYFANTQIDTNYQTDDQHVINDYQMASASFPPNASQPPDSGNTLLLNPCRKSKKKFAKKTDADELLTNLKRKKRKLLRRSAREAMHVASSSDIPILRQMANVLKFKMEDNTIRITDIQSLEKAIVKKLQTKQTPMKLRNRRKSVMKGR